MGLPPVLCGMFHTGSCEGQDSVWKETQIDRYFCFSFKYPLQHRQQTNVRGHKKTDVLWDVSLQRKL